MRERCRDGRVMTPMPFLERSPWGYIPGSFWSLHDYSRQRAIVYRGPQGNGRAAVVKLLREKGAELEPKNEESRTPPSLAAEMGHEAVMKLLLEKGAQLESQDTEYGQMPLSWAAMNEHEAVVKLLLG